jgi:hypothetical protein
VVVVYKVDRLTRSLTDFAKLVELFDEHGVSFVSVTQAFNTTTSMGRLTLNVLLSFAQFEREVTGERIRDKIAASKRKGLWMGGQVPLGYRVEDRKLVIDAEEAETVRLIFGRYLALGSLPLLQGELRQAGIVSRRRTLSSGRVIGGVPFTNGPLAHMLRNRVYLGKINHKGASHAGEHEPIIERDLFDAVQTKLTENRQGARKARASSEALLLGRIFDDRGNRMTPSYAVKNGARYRYYVSSVLAQGRKHEAGSVRRVPAPELEKVVMGAIGADPSALAETNPHKLVERLLYRVVVTSGNIELSLRSESDAPLTPVFVPWTLAPNIRKREVIGAAGGGPETRPIRAEARARLLHAIAKARHWVLQLIAGDFTNTDQVARHENCSERSVRMTLVLAFLSPEIVKAAIAGRLPRELTLIRLAEAPISWAEQQSRFELAHARPE